MVVRDGINWNFLESVAKQTLTLKNEGINPILVGSGAKALGEQNAYKGQRALLEGWRRAFDRYNLNISSQLAAGLDGQLE